MTTLEEPLTAQLQTVFRCQGSEKKLAAALQANLRGRGTRKFPAYIGPSDKLLISLQQHAEGNNKGAQRSLESLKGYAPHSQRETILQRLLSMSGLPEPWYANPSTVLPLVTSISYKWSNDDLRVWGERQTPDFSQELWEHFALTIGEVAECNSKLARSKLSPGSFGFKLSGMSMGLLERRQQRLKEFVPNELLEVLTQRLRPEPIYIAG